ncbi:MAG: MaoC family dehydratase [Chloroflexi bacterium]|nr:MaoC family dehydratase [Chloroflexota bacterium]MDA1226777.1 MaoC family dehydratase [Chloroflexota bacterium]
MPVDYAKLAPGDEISSRTLVLDEESVDRYADAVADANVVYNADGVRLVPPMAIAALSLGGVISDLQIPGGAVHASQELEFPKAVVVGAALECTARLVGNSTRGDWRFMVVDIRVAGDGGTEVMTGKSTIMLPT